MQAQNNGFNLSSLSELSLRELKEAAYQLSLPYLIQEEIYRKHPKAIRYDWKLGQIHNEWWELLFAYDGIVIKAPRDHLKTFFFAEAYCLYLAKFHPGQRIKIFSKSDGLAVDILDHIKEWARTCPYFNDLLTGAATNNRGEAKFAGGTEITVAGLNSSVRGGHPDVIILDDPIDSDVVYSDEANEKSKIRLASEIFPMAEPHTKIIITGTLQRDNDLYSVDFSSLIDDDHRRWVSRTYDAIVDEQKERTLFPEKWDWPRLMSKKKEIIALAGEKWFNKEYRNMPVDAAGEIIKPEWKKTYRMAELPKDVDVYTGWDLSVGNKPETEEGDFTAKITFAVTKDRSKIYILSAFRKRADFSERIRKITEFGDLENPNTIGIENNVFQADTVQEARKKTLHSIKGVRTAINKVQKYNEMLVPLFENGRVYLLEGDAAQEEFWKELSSLPRGAHDDMADAFCVGLKVMYAPQEDWIPLFTQQEVMMAIYEGQHFGEKREGIYTGPGDNGIVVRSSSYATIEMARQGTPLEVATQAEKSGKDIARKYANYWGRGQETISELQKAKIPVVRVDENAPSTFSGQYADKRSEMYGRLREWVKKGGRLQPNEAWKALIHLSYRVDSHSRMEVIGLDQLGKDHIELPPVIEALALTFNDGDGRFVTPEDKFFEKKMAEKKKKNTPQGGYAHRMTR